MKKNENGFSALETILILVIVALVGFVSWYVYSTDKKSNDTNISTTKPLSKTNNSQSAWQLFVQPKDSTTSFKYPKSWTLGTADGPDIGDGTKNVSVTSSSGAELDLISVGAGRGGDCMPDEHSVVSYAKKISGTTHLYVVEWELIGGDSSPTKGLDVLSASTEDAKAFASIGDHPGCMPQYFSFASTKGNHAGYTFGFNRGDGSKELSADDSVVAKQILGSLTVQ